MNLIEEDKIINELYKYANIYAIDNSNFTSSIKYNTIINCIEIVKEQKKYKIPEELENKMIIEGFKKYIEENTQPAGTMTIEVAKNHCDDSMEYIKSGKGLPPLNR